MRSVLAIVIRLATTLGLALLVPLMGSATPGTSAAGNCTSHNGGYTLTLTLTVNNQGVPSVSPSTNANGTCVQGGDTVSVDSSSLPANATWSFTFATNVNLFQNGCQFGNGSQQHSSCKVLASPPPYTYTYQVTVNGNSIDPKIIVKGTGMPARAGVPRDDLMTAASASRSVSKSFAG
ncbi:MAG TPA: hypothetical protein VMT20_10775 [Terriglobia bacterium]|nr:hypothetical protein [Terriglobia bacterium]